MAISKVIYKSSASAQGETWMDVTGKTVTASSMLNGVTALKNDGTDVTGNIANMTLPSSASATSSGTSKATITPTSSAQYINIPVGYNGTAQYYTVSAASGSSKNAQVVQSTTRTNASTLTAIGAELTVSKTGTYDIYYSCFRTNTSSSYTWATRLYINGTAYGTAENATWTNNQQNTHLSNISLTTGDKLRVYGRNTRGTSYYICAPMLAIVEA